MKNQKGLGLIGVLLIIGAFLLTAGGVVVWEKKVLPTPTPNPPALLTPTTVPSRAQSCTSDNDCPKQLCQPPDQPCAQYSCILGKCQLVKPSTTNIFCRTDADCPQHNVLIPKCLNNRCVYIKDTSALESCLKEAENTRRRICEESGAHLDEYGNCVGVDFVKDPYQECYDKYGQ